LAVVDLVLKGGKLVTSRGLVEAGVEVNDGKIASISKASKLRKAVKVIDCRGKIILPGVVDVHAHIFSPGWLKETFRSGTKAAALGGVTTVLDMPSMRPFASSSPQGFQRKLAHVEREAYVDFGLYGGEIEYRQHVDAISDLVELGAVGFKMITGGPGYIDEGVLIDAFRRIALNDSIAVVHAENQTLIHYFLQLARQRRRRDPAAWAEFRPSTVEEEAIRRVMLFASVAGNRLHIAHLTSKRGLEAVKTAKATNSKVTTETCPHYLLLSTKDYRRYGHRMVVTPPIKKGQDSEALWEGINDGTIDLITSDHCAYYKKVKDKGARSVWATPPGIPGLETMLPLILSEGVNKSRISLRRLTQVMSEAPARIFGLYPRKGTIRQGADADLTIVDLKRRYRIDAEIFECAGDFSPFDGWRVRGGPVITVVRGNVVAECGQIVGSAGYGRFTKPRGAV
jgi:D-hydantoinase